MQPEGPKHPKAPHFNFLQGFWPLHFANMIKHFFVKFCRKSVNVLALWGPQHVMGACASCALPGCTTAGQGCGVRVETGIGVSLSQLFWPE